MDRDLDQDQRDILERTQGETIPEPRHVHENPAAGREREAALGRHCTYRLSQAERETMHEIGRFRTVAIEDLSRYKYKGDSAQMRQDLRSLTAQGLVQRRTAYVGRRQGNLAVLVLSKEGKDLLDRTCQTPSQQALYAGFVKPSEVAHDAAIYRMYQAEAVLIQKQGGTIQRVVLDYELKRKVYSPLAKAKHLPPGEYAKRQAAVAQENGLKVVRAKIPLPDLRIEYRTRDGELAQVDLELATHHYHGSHMSAKAEAGFKMYAAEGSFSRLSRVLDEHDITADILSL